MGRSVRKQDAVFSDTHTHTHTLSLSPYCCAVRLHGPPTSGLCSTDDSQWTRILPFPQRAELWGGMRRGTVLSTKVAYVCRPMRSVLTTGGGVQAGTKYWDPGGPQGGPHNVPSIYGATAPSGSWPPSQDASIHPYIKLFSSILLSPAAVMHPSGPHPRHLVLGLPTGLWCRSFRLKPFLESVLLPFLLCHLPILIFRL